ncbi:restriction endonuclease [Pseudoramibacter alactolyticus ATCC 23263]|uniref:Restriction endonuclease n=1 Tax=Pseudoramibacter alactolyticus ATCC 23263 TaxID=887929 RepID=E6MGV8_9FIRM|nr:restriction endonuclease [Pseudoramibacter alactolyticus]EFV01848.1 restriction endonuclease [Pseudoramibacter alactolyticus ATCC 23263]
MLKYDDLIDPTLRILSDGQEQTSKAINERLSEKLQLTDEQTSALLPSGKQTVFSNRAGWARTYLKKAGLITSPRRAHFVISEKGKAALLESCMIDLSYLRRFSEFRSFESGVPLVKNDTSQNERIEDRTPLETLEAAFSMINDALQSDLMDEVMKLSPFDFEHLVVRLLLAMGYGSGIEEAGIVTQASNDGGIDGIIKEDQLGFSSIYIQVKQWQIESTVGKPEIQKFAGALLEQNAAKGLFITTASYSQKARDYAKNSGGATIVLIDGKQLTRLMIKHNLGVSIETTYAIKRVDYDFFSEDI